MGGARDSDTLECGSELRAGDGGPEGVTASRVYVVTIGGEGDMPTVTSEDLALLATLDQDAIDAAAAELIKILEGSSEGGFVAVSGRVVLRTQGMIDDIQNRTPLGLRFIASHIAAQQRSSREGGVVSAEEYEVPQEARATEQAKLPYRVKVLVHDLRQLLAGIARLF